MSEPVPKCPDCGSLNIQDKITCLNCGYEYFVWDIATPEDVKKLFDKEMDRQIREKVGHTKRYPCAECGGGLCEMYDQ